MSQLRELKSKLSTLDAKTRYYIFIGVVVLVLFADIFLIMWPQFKNFGAIKKKTSDLTVQIKTLATNKLRTNQFHQQVKDLQVGINILKRRVHPAETMPDILESISRAANTHRVKIDQLMPLKNTQEQLLEDATSKYSSISIVIKGESGYHNFVQFLTKLEKEDVFIEIINLDILANPSDIHKHYIDMTLSVILAEAK